MNEPDPILINSDFQLTSEPEETKPRDIQMSELTELADTLVELDSAVTEAEAALSELKQKRRTIAEEHLPQLMEQAGIETLKLSSGKKIAIQDFVDARIKDPIVAFDWLRETNNESIIKNQITIALGRNEDDRAQEIVNKLKREYNIDADQRVTVHNMTLKSFCKDALDNPELAESLPREAFGIYQGKRAKVN
jgi:hypothetical protein